MQITQIKINGIREPVGFRLDRPCISYKVTETASKRAVNSSIRVSCADDPETVLAEFTGEDVNSAGTRVSLELKPRTAYLVRILVEGDAGDSAEAESRFETGKMDESWQAEWIAPAKGDGCHPMIRRKLTVRPGLKKARLYASGVGMFEAYVNGRKLGEEYLKPGVTNYEKRIQTVTFPVESLEEGVALSNELAPEHLELSVSNPEQLLPLVINAGSVFMGRCCPESLGDYLAGPNHILPTSGTARFSSPLGVDDFIKKTQYTYYTKDALSQVAGDIAVFARAEGLEAHARAALIRGKEA